MKTPIDKVTVLARIDDYFKNANNTNFDYGSKFITGHKFSRKELQDVAQKSPTHHIFIMLGLVGAAANKHIQLILTGVNDVTDNVDISYMLPSDSTPYIGSINFCKGISLDSATIALGNNPIGFENLIVHAPAVSFFGGDKNKIELKLLNDEVFSEDVDTLTLLTALGRYLLNNEVNPLCKDDLVCNKVLGYHLVDDDLIQLDLFNAQGGADDQFIFIPVLMGKDKNGNDVKPYLSYALFEIQGNGKIKCEGREYFDPCPDDCDVYNNFIA